MPSVLPVLFRVRLAESDSPQPVEVSADPAEPMAAVVARLHVQHHLSGMPADWRLVRGGRPVDVDAEAGQVGAGGELTLERVGYSGISPPQAPRVVVPIPASGGWPAMPKSGGWPTPPKSPPPGPVLPPARPTPPPALSPPPADGPTPSHIEYQMGGVRPAADPKAAAVRFPPRMAPFRPHRLTVAVPPDLAAGVDIEPQLPGCVCHPPRRPASVSVDGGPATADFWVIPQMVGAVPDARVVARSGGRVVGEVRVDIRAERAVVPPALAAVGAIAAAGWAFRTDAVGAVLGLAAVGLWLGAAATAVLARAGGPEVHWYIRR